MTIKLYFSVYIDTILNQLFNLMPNLQPNTFNSIFSFILMLDTAANFKLQSWEKNLIVLCIIAQFSFGEHKKMKMLKRY